MEAVGGRERLHANAMVHDRQYVKGQRNSPYHGPGAR